MHPQLERCYAAAVRGAWHHPFFLIPLGHCEWIEADPKKCPTAAVQEAVVNGKPEIRLFINPEWVATLNDDVLFGLMAHEIMHVMLRHGERAGGKNPETWGKAADMAINASLTQGGIQLDRSALLPPAEHFEASAEEIYTLLEAEEIKDPPQYDPSKVGRGCAPLPKGQGGAPTNEPGNEPGQGQGEGEGEGPGEGEGNSPSAGEGQGQGSGDSQDDDRAWGEMCAQAQAHGRGSKSMPALARQFKAKPVKTSWKRLLRKMANRAQAKGGRDVQTYQRINRRSTDIIFPGWQSSSPSIAVIIDSSGSVSDEMLRTALSNVKDIAKSTHVRIFMALHDARCYWSGWVEPEISVEQMSRMCNHRGGTDPREAFEAIASARGRFDVGVYLTDGEVGDYPDKPMNVKRMAVGVLGEGRYRTPTPDSWQEVMVEVSSDGD